MESKTEGASGKSTILHAYCHCRIHTYAFSIPDDQLPLSANHCHCNMCRLTNGALFESYVDIPSTVKPYTASSPPPATLKAFSCTPNVKRFFCLKCGTHLFWNNTTNSSWAINSGALAKAGSGLVKYDQHIYVEECPKEAGMGLFNLLDDGLPRYATGSDAKLPLKDEEINSLLAITKPSKSETIDPSKRLLMSCYCGRVRAQLSRPSAHPENQSLEESATPDKTKWLGSHCSCESCRLSTGAVVSSFIFVPVDYLEWLPSEESGSGPEDDPLAGKAGDWRAKAGMTWWKSSETVVRGFCGTCGAAVLYQDKNRRPGIEELRDQGWAKWGTGINVISDQFIGLLRTSNKEGERLADWVEFEDEIHFAEDLDGYDGNMKENLLRGSKKHVELQASSTSARG